MNPMDEFLRDTFGRQLKLFGRPVEGVPSQGVPSRRPHPLSRPLDPMPSHEAALKVTESKIRASSQGGYSLQPLQAWAESLVSRFPDSTANELAMQEGVRDPRSIGRRLNELERAGRITRGPARACRITGFNASTWRPANG